MLILYTICDNNGPDLTNLGGLLVYKVLSKKAEKLYKHENMTCTCNFFAKKRSFSFNLRFGLNFDSIFQIFTKNIGA